MATIRAHFDGRVFVPEEPVDVPKNVPLRLTLDVVPEAGAPLMDLARLGESFPDDPAWPADGAAQLDHYLYGAPKRTA